VEAAAAADPRSAAEAEDGEGDPLGEAFERSPSIDILFLGCS